MAKNSNYLLRQQVRRDIENRQLRRFTVQQCTDFLIIAANEEFGFGEERCKRLCSAFFKAFETYAGLLEADTKDIEYTKSIVDRKLEQILGDSFEDWETRYKEVI